MDRISQLQRPPQGAAMFQRWRQLLFMHWPIPISELRPLIPSELEIDTFDGVAFVGLVPFTMLGIRPKWAPVLPGITKFHETNLRTYVHYRGENPGVWFFSLDAANSLAVRIARAWYKLPYFRSTMEIICGRESTKYKLERHWPAPSVAAMTCEYVIGTTPVVTSPESLEFFLIQRYLLYSKSGSKLRSVQVFHKPYDVVGASIISLEETVSGAAGIRLSGNPPLIHYSAGVDVEVFSPRLLNSS